MARLDERDDTYFTTVRGMCRTCRQIRPARVSFRGEQVWQHTLCPTCQTQPALIAADKQWYLDRVLRPMPDRAPLACAHPPRLGCPHDCGPCAWHASPCQLPVLSVTNACELRCPICFTYNRPDRVYHMPIEEMRRTVDWIVQSSGPVDLINITGGEPTLHPEILDILACCRRPEIGRITMNSNGLRLAGDRELCDRLAELGVCVILSFNTFDGGVSRTMHGRDIVGAKLQALDNLARAGVRVTLLNVLARGLNENALPGLLDLMRSRDNVLSLTVQTMTFTGQGGGRFATGQPGTDPTRPRHIPVDAAARMIADASGGELAFEDFHTRPSAHPLCYQVCYMLKSGRRLLPFARFADRGRLENLLAGSYLIRLGEQETFFREMIDELFARDERDLLAVFRKLIERVYPSAGPISEFDRQQRAEQSVRTVYVHAHMDEDTFDCSRAMMCPDLVPAAPGRLIPACTYNLFYRMRDDRFYVPPPGAGAEAGA